jgi:hypothetical protein
MNIQFEVIYQLKINRREKLAFKTHGYLHNYPVIAPLSALISRHQYKIKCHFTESCRTSTSGIHANKARGWSLPGSKRAIDKAQEEANDEWKQLKKAGHCDQLYRDFRTGIPQRT